MSLLSVIQDASLLVGLEKPTTAISSTDVTAQQLVALCQQAGAEMAGLDWRELKLAGLITGDASTEFWTLPTSFDRLLPGDAFWSLNFPSVPLGGPVTDEEMLALRALPIRPVRPVWRLIGNDVEIWPALASGEVVNFEFRTNNWIATASDPFTPALSRWTDDTNVALIPEDILTLSVVWRWKRAKGFDYSMEQDTYNKELNRKLGQDQGSRTIRTARGLRPDGIWGPSPISPIIVT